MAPSNRSTSHQVSYDKKVDKNISINTTVVENKSDISVLIQNLRVINICLECFKVPFVCWCFYEYVKALSTKVFLKLVNQEKGLQFDWFTSGDGIYVLCNIQLY